MICPASKCKWTEPELGLLATTYLATPTAKLARKLGRSPQAVRAKAHQIGLAWRDVGRTVKGRRRG